jgi:transcriptional regulator with XRE-family HTH domain
MPPSNITLKTIGHNIRKHRLEKRLTQQYLATRTGLSGSEISRLENGKRNISLKLLLQIADILGIPPAEIFK